MEIPKHPIEAFAETGDEAYLDGMSKSNLIALLNVGTGYDRTDDDGESVPVTGYTNTINKDELREAVKSLSECGAYEGDD